ncbi:hypothetical protein MHH70_16725 [Metasolibacillus sp. FSL H7-0170]|uniref:hypothetical protein n=1 Tax=Metasolibacillus TaxID=2703677 RepID=UPI000D3C7E4D|nr:hypothetical protein [Metasolibacillus fluoroglycofenilyticus]
MTKMTITYCDEDFELSEEFVKITLGLDEFYKKTQNSSQNGFLKTEGLVPVQLVESQVYQYGSFAHILEDYRSLYSRLNNIQNELRREYMAKQINGMMYYIRYLEGKAHSFRNIVRNLLFVDSNPVAGWKINRIQQRLEAQLKAAGYSGTVQQMYKKWFEDRKVETDDMLAVLTNLIQTAKEDVSRKMFDDIHSIEAKPKLVKDVPFSAYADYKSREMLINADYHYTYEDLKHLVTHEVFPGHFTHMYKREQAVKCGKIPLDASLVITNSASSPIFEGIADCGQIFLGWDENEHDEIAKTAQQLKMCTTLNASYLLNELQLDKSEVANYLASQAFGQENWIKSRISFIEDFIRGPFIYSYYRGLESLLPIVQSVPIEEKQDFYHLLYENMLTADELKIF